MSLCATWRGKKRERDFEFEWKTGRQQSIRKRVFRLLLILRQIQNLFCSFHIRSNLKSSCWQRNGHAHLSRLIMVNRCIWTNLKRFLFITEKQCHLRAIKPFFCYFLLHFYVFPVHFTAGRLLVPYFLPACLPPNENAAWGRQARCTVEISEIKSE